MSSAFPSSNPNRASLLAGLRTGGVRPPQTAAPNVVAFDPQQMQIPVQPMQSRGFMTAAVDGPNNSFAAQQTQSQQMQMNPYQFQQAMQFEMLKLQAMQAQQYQTELLRQQQQVQQQQQQQPQQRRSSFQPPNTAAVTGSFDLRVPRQNDSLKPSGSVEQQVPMTARLDGKFGTRTASMPSTGTTVISGGTSLGSLSSNNAKEVTAPSKSDTASSWRRGSSNGNSALQALRDRAKAAPAALSLTEKRTTPPPADAPPTAASAGMKRPKPLSFNLQTQKPMIPEVLIDTSEADEDVDDASSASGSSRGSSRDNKSGKSSPTTSNELLAISEPAQMPLSPREEATKKLYEGLGIGRPRSRNSDNADQPPSPRAPSISIAPPQTAALFPTHSSGFGAFPQSPFMMAPVPNTASLTGPNYGQHRMDHRSATQPKRQPRGPPSNQEELGPLNFAARSPRLPPSTAGLVGSMQSLAVEAY